MADKLEQNHPQATLEAATQLMRDWIPAFAGMTRPRWNDKASIEHRQRTSDINSNRKVVL